MSFHSDDWANWEGIGGWRMIYSARADEGPAVTALRNIMNNCWNAGRSTPLTVMEYAREAMKLGGWLDAD